MAQVPFSVFSSSLPPASSVSGNKTAVFSADRQYSYLQNGSNSDGSEQDKTFKTMTNVLPFAVFLILLFFFNVYTSNYKGQLKTIFGVYIYTYRNIDFF